MFARLLFMLSSVLSVVVGNVNPTHAENSSQVSELLPVVSAHKASIYALAFSPDGMILASAGADQSVAIWNTRTWQLVRRLEGEFGIIRALAFSADGSVLAAGTDKGTVQLWKTATWAKPETISAHKEDVRVLAFGRDGLLITAGRDDKPRSKTRLKRVQSILSLDRTDDVIKVWDTSKGSLSHTLPKATSRVISLRLSPSGQFLVSGSEDGEIAVISTETWRTAKRLKFQNGTLKTLNFDTSGTRLVGSGYRQGLTRKYRRTTNVWETSDWTLVTASEDQTSPIRTIDYDPRENQLVTGNRNGTVTLLSLNLDSAKTLGKVRKLEFDKPINVMRFSPDGRTLVSGNADGTINVLEHLLPVPTSTSFVISLKPIPVPKPALFVASSVPIPMPSVIALKPVPIPEPVSFVTPKVPILIPAVTGYFNAPLNILSVIIGIGILLFPIWVIYTAHRFVPRGLASILLFPIWVTYALFRSFLRSAEARRQGAVGFEAEKKGAARNEMRSRVLSPNQGYVYLLKSGPYYKIGRSKDFNKRIKVIKLQLPFNTEQVHVVETSDMIKLENEWHRRFKAKRENGEWFRLSDADVREFKRQPSLRRFR